MFGLLVISDIGENVMHALLVASAGGVLIIAVSAYARRRTSRYLYLVFAFLFLLLSQVDSLYETLFFSNNLVVIPVIGLHLAHLLILFMILFFGVAIIPRQLNGDEESRLRTQ